MGVPDELVETNSDEALLDWVVDHKLADPEAFVGLVEDLYEHPDETSRDDVRLTDDRIFDRYSAPVIGDDGTNYGRLWVFRDITDRKEHERELERQEFLFSRVQEIADVGVWEYDPQTDDITWSNGIRHIHGVDADYEPTLEEAIDFYHPDDRDEITSAVTRAIEDGEEYDLELRIVRPDGDVRDVRARGEVSTDARGETNIVRGVFQDITDRKERERKLREFKEAVEHAGHAIYITDTDGTIEYVNPEFEEVTGYTAEQAIGETPEILRSGEHDGDFYEDLWNTIRAGQHWEREMIDERKDGEEIILDQTIAPIETDDGAVEGFVAVNHDITERKRREQELAEEREKYATLVEQSHDGVVIVQNAEFVFVNPRFTAITGYEEDELLGMPFSDVVAPENQQLARERYERRLDPDADPPPSRYTLTFETKDGRKRVAEVSVAVIQYQDAPAALVSIRDVTKRQQYEDELERLNEELEVLNRVVRHDIRNDMSVMLGWGELLEDHVDDAGTEHLEKILTSGEHIVELTEIARDYVETLTSDEEVDVKPTRLREILTNEITLRREAHSDAEIGLDGPIPDP
ncbi:MAG: PAS domain S-box protein [Haloplanus sp.]